MQFEHLHSIHEKHEHELSRIPLTWQVEGERLSTWAAGRGSILKGWHVLSHRCLLGLDMERHGVGSESQALFWSVGEQVGGGLGGGGAIRGEFDSVDSCERGLRRGPWRTDRVRSMGVRTLVRDSMVDNVQLQDGRVLDTLASPDPRRLLGN